MHVRILESKYLNGFKYLLELMDEIKKFYILPILVVTIPQDCMEAYMYKNSNFVGLNLEC